MPEPYNPQELEPKWQQYWLTNNLFATPPTPKKKKYVLDMFPYPSGDGLHVGHAKIYTASDIIARYYRLQGFSVLHPTGWDAFGLPTENSAIKFGIHPAELTKRNINRFREQMQRLGLSYDWQREVNTTDPAYYEWTQWIFLQLYKQGLAYEATVPINWCPTDKTGLANEEVIDGKCERCGTPVEQKPLRQWLLRITAYAEQLLASLDELTWPPFILELQKNWIGRSAGALLTFPIPDHAPEAIQVFTTRADTLYGVTYLVVAPEHPLVTRLLADDTAPLTNRAQIKEYVSSTSRKTELQRQTAEKTKTGVELKGIVAQHPATKQTVPIWVADYVLMSYGTGAVMAVPAHDERDYAFAVKHELPVVAVIEPPTGPTQLPYTGDGTLINSEQFNGQTSAAAATAIAEHVDAEIKLMYKLRDWVFSRQRYWGEPIPLIHCAQCGIVPVPEAELPVVLPDIERYEPTGTGESPLADIPAWVNVSCPQCGQPAQRETNTMPQWAGSSWYFLRFADPHNDHELASHAALKTWLPVDLYIGGAEHAVLHLLYARFWMHALADANIIPLREPFIELHNVGLVLGEDGQKMSKSRGNVINPDDVITTYGADTLRIYEMFLGPFDASAQWSTGGIAGAERFLKRVWQRVLTLQQTPGDASPELTRALQSTIKRVTEGIEAFKFNTGIAALMEFLNLLDKETVGDTDVLRTYVLLLSPYAPHIAEELWQRLGQSDSVSQATWPTIKEELLQAETLTLPVQVNGKVRGSITVPPGTEQSAVEAAARLVPNVERHLTGKEIINVIFVPDRLLNFVAK